MATYLKENPRLMGVLFTLMMLLASTGTAAANGGYTIF